MNLRSTIYALLAVICWSTVATAFKLTLQGMNFAQLLFYSSLASTIILFAIAIYRTKKNLFSNFTTENIRNNILLGFINPFLYYLVLFKAYSLLPAYEAQPLNYTWPIMIAIMSAIFLKEKLKLSTLIGLVIAFTGVTVIATRGNIFGFEFQNPLGVSLAAGSSIIWGAYWIINLKDKREISIKLFYAFLSGTVFTGIYILLFDTFRISNYNYLLGAAYIGIFEMGITFFFWLQALSLSTNNAKTSTLAYLSPFISLLFIYFILNEQITLSAVIGLILIISGILFQQFDLFKKKVT